MQTLYQIVKTLHIFGFIVTVGITIANLIAHQQFWKLYRRDQAQGISAFQIVEKLQIAGMVGMIVVLLAGISMLAIMHWSFVTILWFQIKLTLIVLIFVNGVTMGRTSAMKVQALIKQKQQPSDLHATVDTVQNRTRLFFTTQLILFSTIVVLSVFRFT